MRGASKWDTPVRVGKLIPSDSRESNDRHGRYVLVSQTLLLLLALMFGIWTLVCLYDLKNRSMATNAMVLRAGSAPECLTGEACAGICPTGAETECPTLAFRTPNALDWARICTTERMCQWHTTLRTQAPWVGFSFEDNPGVHPRHQLYDARLRDVCLQALDVTDATTQAAVDSECITVSWQTFRELGGKRNTLTDWQVICQYHYACAATNTAAPVFISPDK